MINIIPTAIPGVVIIEPKVFGDARGYFFESFSERDFNEAMTPILGHSIKFVQDNESMSSYGVMRGLHFQTMPYTQSKLVRCVKGAVLDVAVDIRKGSPTYGQHVACLLTGRDEEGMRIAERLSIESPSLGGVMGGSQFFIPRGFAHGFAVLSETAVFQYKCDEFYHPEADAGISIFSYSPAAGSLPYAGESEGSFGIDWHIPVEKALLSEKDTKHALLKDFDSPFSIDMDLYPQFK